MTSPEFWLTVLSSVIGAGIGAAIAYYFGNRQIKKQINHNIEIYKASIRHGSIIDIRNRLLEILINELPEMKKHSYNVQKYIEEYEENDSFPEQEFYYLYNKPESLFDLLNYITLDIMSISSPEINQDRIDEIKQRIEKTDELFRENVKDKNGIETIYYIMDTLDSIYLEVNELLTILGAEKVLLEHIEGKTTYINNVIKNKK